LAGYRNDVLLPKSEDTMEKTSSTYLLTAYKMLTRTIARRTLSHLKEQNLLLEEEKGSKEYKNQLLI